MAGVIGSLAGEALIPILEDAGDSLDRHITQPAIKAIAPHVRNWFDDVHANISPEYAAERAERRAQEAAAAKRRLQSEYDLNSDSPNAILRGYTGKSVFDQGGDRYNRKQLKINHEDSRAAALFEQGGVGAKAQDAIRRDDMRGFTENERGYVENLMREGRNNAGIGKFREFQHTVDGVRHSRMRWWT